MWQESLSILSLIITIGMLIGGIVAYRYGFARTTNEVQERVIHTLESEIESLHERISALEQENTHLHQTITRLCLVLKEQGIHVTIEGDEIKVHDSSSDTPSSGTRIFGSKTYTPHSEQEEIQQRDPRIPPRASRRHRRKHTSRFSPEEGH
ncbi:MAG TPA: hypothetical protein VFB12_14755 [Ktedonobacteraceae bacterium]|nr:hypothetical protein [Ktedonobacteraceae bacterium]